MKDVRLGAAPPPAPPTPAPATTSTPPATAPAATPAPATLPDPTGVVQDFVANSGTSGALAPFQVDGARLGAAPSSRGEVMAAAPTTAPAAAEPPPPPSPEQRRDASAARVRAAQTQVDSYNHELETIPTQKPPLPQPQRQALMDAYTKKLAGASAELYAARKDNLEARGEINGNALRQSNARIIELQTQLRNPNLSAPARASLQTELRNEQNHRLDLKVEEQQIRRQTAENELSNPRPLSTQDQATQQQTIRDADSQMADLSRQREALNRLPLSDPGPPGVIETQGGAV